MVLIFSSNVAYALVEQDEILKSDQGLMRVLDTFSKRELSLLARVVQSEEPTPEKILTRLTWLYGNPLSKVYRLAFHRSVSYPMILETVGKFYKIEVENHDISKLEDQIIQVGYVNVFTRLNQLLTSEEREQLISLIEKESKRQGLAPLFNIHPLIVHSHSFLPVMFNLNLWLNSTKERGNSEFEKNRFIHDLRSFIADPGGVMKELRFLWKRMDQDKETLSKFVAVFSLLRKHGVINIGTNLSPM